jgi:uncharacterized membrane protein
LDSSDRRAGLLARWQLYASEVERGVSLKTMRALDVPKERYSKGGIAEEEFDKISHDMIS